MSHDLYRQFLTEEEKFLKQLEKNLQDQTNRLKVEELALLKLIRSSNDSEYHATTPAENDNDAHASLLPSDSHGNLRSNNEECESDSDDDLPLARLQTSLISKQLEETVPADESSIMKDLAVNNISLDLNVAHPGVEPGEDKIEIEEEEEEEEDDDD